MSFKSIKKVTNLKTPGIGGGKSKENNKSDMELNVKALNGLYTIILDTTQCSRILLAVGQENSTFA